MSNIKLNRTLAVLQCFGASLHRREKLENSPTLLNKPRFFLLFIHNENIKSTSVSYLGHNRPRFPNNQKMTDKWTHVIIQTENDQ